MAKCTGTTFRPEDVACVHRGELLGERQCNLCGMREETFDVFACAVFGECSFTRKRRDVQSCLACEKRLAPVNPTV